MGLCLVGFADGQRELARWSPDVERISAMPAMKA
jgi:hypothetical protein